MPGPVFIEGERVALRTVEEADLSFIRQNISNPRVWRTLDRTRPMDGIEGEKWLRRRSDDDAVLDLLAAVDESPVGFVSIREDNDAWGTAWLSFWITPSEQGKGYGTAAARLAVEYTFDQRRRHKLIAHVFEGNEGSVRLLERLGFQREGVHREEVYRDGSFWDLYTYGLLADEYDADV